MSRRAFTLSALSCLGLGAAGCSTLPSSGPRTEDIQQPIDGTALPYILVQVSGDTIVPLSRVRALSLQGTFGDRRPAPLLRLGVGDVVSVSIFEAAPGGLFTPAQTAGARPGNFVDLPTQSVDQDGNISVPYAGLIPAAGRTIPEVQATIQQRLINRAIEPQAVVALREQRANTVSVLGEVNQPGVFALSTAGERILAVLARAGGPRYQALESIVTVQRNGRRARVRLTQLVNNPAENMFLQPGDTLFLTREAPLFIVTGASGQNGLFQFDTEEVTLAQAIGKSGGLLDTQADPAAVFIYRLEEREFLRRVGADPSAFAAGPVPTIYRLDLKDPTGYLMASRFQMRDKDVIYVANAPTVDFLKLLTVFNAVSSSIQNGRLGVQAVRNPL